MTIDCCIRQFREKQPADARGSSKNLNAASVLKLIENQERKDKRMAETFDDEDTEFELSDSDEDDAKVIKVRLKLGNMKQ